MVGYTGRNGTAGVGDTNPDVEIYVEEVGQFTRGSHHVEISEVGAWDSEGRKLETVGFPMRYQGRNVGTDEQKLLLEKARRLAKATLSGAVTARYLGIVRTADGPLGGAQVVRFFVSRNR